MDEREIELGNLLAETLVAFDEGRSADVDRLLDSAGDDRLELVEMVELSLTLRGPASPSSAHMPCRLRSAGRFSIRNSGRSALRRKAAKTAASRPRSIA